ncbi:MAG: glutamate racemase, partial [Syntrophales bacterium]
SLVDSAEAMADITANLLADRHLGNHKHMQPKYRFFVTDVPYHFQTIGEGFLGRTLSHVELVKL